MYTKLSTKTAHRDGQAYTDRHTHAHSLNIHALNLRVTGKGESKYWYTFEDSIDIPKHHTWPHVTVKDIGKWWNDQLYNYIKHVITTKKQNKEVQFDTPSHVHTNTRLAAHGLLSLVWNHMVLKIFKALQQPDTHTHTLCARTHARTHALTHTHTYRVIL